jgi:ribosomal protein L40E
MALTNCRECNYKVATDAYICPNCGARYPWRPKLDWLGFSALALIALIVYAVLRMTGAL